MYALERRPTKANHYIWRYEIKFWSIGFKKNYGELVYAGDRVAQIVQKLEAKYFKIRREKQIIKGKIRRCIKWYIKEI